MQSNMQYICIEHTKYTKLQWLNTNDCSNSDARTFSGPDMLHRHSINPLLEQQELINKGLSSPTEDQISEIEINNLGSHQEASALADKPKDDRPILHDYRKIPVFTTKMTLRERIKLQRGPQLPPNKKRKRSRSPPSSPSRKQRDRNSRSSRPTTTTSNRRRRHRNRSPPPPRSRDFDDLFDACGSRNGGRRRRCQQKCRCCNC